MFSWCSILLVLDVTVALSTGGGEFLFPLLHLNVLKRTVCVAEHTVLHSKHEVNDLAKTEK